jgi:hypothetical protein
MTVVSPNLSNDENINALAFVYLNYFYNCSMLFAFD